MGTLPSRTITGGISEAWKERWREIQKRLSRDGAIKERQGPMGRGMGGMMPGMPTHPMADKRGSFTPAERAALSKLGGRMPARMGTLPPIDDDRRLQAFLDGVDDPKPVSVKGLFDRFF